MFVALIVEQIDHGYFSRDTAQQLDEMYSIHRFRETGCCCPTFGGSTQPLHQTVGFTIERPMSNGGGNGVEIMMIWMEMGWTRNVV
jgi:hypothetical protein